MSNLSKDVVLVEEWKPMVKEKEPAWIICPVHDPKCPIAMLVLREWLTGTPVSLGPLPTAPESLIGVEQLLRGMHSLVR